MQRTNDKHTFNLDHGHQEMPPHRNVRWFLCDFTLTSQYYESSLSVNCHSTQLRPTYGR